MLLSEAITQYLIFLKNNPKSKYTLKNYRFYLNKFLEFTGSKKLSTLGLVDIDNYKNYLDTLTDIRTNQNLKNSTKNYYLIALRSLISFLNSKKMTTLLSEDIALVKQAPRNIQLLNNEQIRLVISSPGKNNKQELRDTLILQLIYFLSLKVQDIVKLNRDSIDMNSLELVVPGSTKSMLMSSEIAETLRIYLISRKDTFTPLFIRFQGVEDVLVEGEKMRLSERGIERIVEKYGQKAGFEGLTPQRMRMSSIGLLIDQGEDVPAVADVLGHKNTGSTLVYVRKSVGGSFARNRF